MPTDAPPAPLPRVIDLTGLPDELVALIHHLVRAERIRRGEPVPPGPPPLTPVFAVPPPKLTLEEKKRMLDEMAAMGSGQALPADWSRADLYEDHD